MPSSSQGSPDEPTRDRPNKGNQSLDLEHLELGPLLKYARAATFAPNWKSVLCADAFLGVLLAVLGLCVGIWLHWAGWALVALGVLYVLLVGRRFLRWRWLRAQAGL